MVKGTQAPSPPGSPASLSFTGSLQAPSLCLRSPWPVVPTPADPNPGLVSEHPVEKWFTRIPCAPYQANSQGRAEGSMPQVRAAEGEQSQETDILRRSGG